MSRVSLKRKVLGENDRIAEGLRSAFRRNGTLALNLISSPGAGKTSLLERTLEALPPDEQVAVLTGDVQTDNDAKRLAHFGFLVQQITTSGACHLDAKMIQVALGKWDLTSLDLLLIENVGNLICPASFDLGEGAKIVVLSVTEGDDKPLKYPPIFLKADLLVLNKTDLLPYVPFDRARVQENALRVNPHIGLVEVSCTTGAGLEEWFRWLEKRREATRTQVATEPG